MVSCVTDIILLISFFEPLEHEETILSLWDLLKNRWHARLGPCMWHAAWFLMVI